MQIHKVPPEVHFSRYLTAVFDLNKIERAQIWHRLSDLPLRILDDVLSENLLIKTRVQVWTINTAHLMFERCYVIEDKMLTNQHTVL